MVHQSYETMLEELNVLANFEDSDFDPILLDQNDQKEEEEKDEENLDEIDSRSEIESTTNTDHFAYKFGPPPPKKKRVQKK
ncbi:hypothetical protein QR98_0067920 [Sarcoptes scabiei]|uniref:Uncharacterized protein n=1 Tax=Sarcoptes scabiei TaxID=52283 RepID=A0A132ABB4_SARSC|nr:hypothetical protein QR98_0067920 [Sarcoptes scabiei]